ncbi:hypothetical protein J7E78_12010 [Paenibacillus polymyxa]|uniref:ATP-binding protein n=1 Tax=Paenibacillus polymyxa TaxID=1406 RepID=UPI001BE8226D|nr:ATP-binding protein [Paenibacillus polymyxa]MBT2284262.1 hypothetical protein [Paenibacillus polymyxa]
MNDLQEVKVVFIGESGCGKSTIIRHLAADPHKLKYASSSEGHAGTTKVTIEYLFSEYSDIVVNSVSCNMNFPKDSSFEFVSDAGFEAYLKSTGNTEKLDRSNDDYEESINEFAKEYLCSMDISQVFGIINQSSTFFNHITIEVPVNPNLHKEMAENGIDILKIVDTRGLGDDDDIERIIPFAGADAIMIVGKSETPTPSIRDGLIKVCQDYKHVPVLFIGKHHINEDEVDVKSSNDMDEYLDKLEKFNKTPDCSIRRLYANVCEEHLELIKPVQDVMNECRINNVPFINSLDLPKAKESNYYKFYVPACVRIFGNCIKTISSYQVAQKEVAEQLRNSEIEIFNAMYTKKLLDSTVGRVTIEPQKYKKFVDFESVAKGYSLRRGSPIEYSYNCVAVTLYSMLKKSIDQVVISADNAISNDILRFFFNRVLQHNSHNWYWGYDNGYYYNVIDFKYQTVSSCKDRLAKINLKLDSVVCTRFDKKYDPQESIQILLLEESLLYLISKLDNDADINNYLLDLSVANSIQ